MITRFGRPVAQVIPPPPQAARPAWVGAMAGRVKIRGDVVGPVAEARDWAAISR